MTCFLFSLWNLTHKSHQITLGPRKRKPLTENKNKCWDFSFFFFFWKLKKKVLKSWLWGVHWNRWKSAGAFYVWNILAFHFQCQAKEVWFLALLKWHGTMFCSVAKTPRPDWASMQAEMLWRPENWSKEQREEEAVNCPHSVNNILVLFCCACCRKQSDNTSKVKFLWEVVYNGSCAHICIWKAKNLEGTFQFRVAAANVLGLGEYSDTSEDIILGEGMYCTF